MPLAEFFDPEVDWRAAEGALDDLGPINGVDATRAYLQDWVEAGVGRPTVCPSRPELPNRSHPGRRNPGPLGGTGVSTFRQMVELAGLEPATSWVRSRRSPN